MIRSVSSSPYTRWVSSMLFPLHERLKGHHTVALLQALEESQWWSPAALRALQLHRLRALLAHAETSVPHYRTQFQTIGFSSQDVQNLSDLAHLPRLDKATIRTAGEAMKSDRARGLARFNTGGSSGEPLIFFIGKERISHDVAAKWRATRWWGVDIGDPEIVVWGSPIELGKQDRIKHWRDRLLRTELLPAFAMSDEKVRGYLEHIRARKPRMLFGYPSALAHFARHAEASGLSMSDLGIRVAFVTSERLYDDQADCIRRVFGCPVANGYGGRDAGFLAHACPEGSMHITAEDVLIEILDAHGQPLADGQSGEIVVTHFATGDFPFIRYRTGDIGAFSPHPCRCGRTLPVLEKIEGRSTDFLVAANGTVMHGLALIYVLRDLPGVRAFKIIQESLLCTRILLVPEGPFDTDLESRIRAGVRARLGAEVEVPIEIVEQIPPERSGKFRYVVSHVAAH